jgi:pimeloyl-ACP methyl ester carboxylesterase
MNRRALRFILRLGAALLVLYLLLLLLVVVGQRKLVYFPSRAPYADLQSRARENGFEAWLNTAGHPIGWWRPAPRGPSRGRVLVVHGNAGYALHRAAFADALQRAAAVDIYLLEYPGYGGREGEPSESTFFAAGDEAIRSLPAEPGVFVVGESLGTGVACYLAGKNPSRVLGLLLVAPYDQLANVAQDHFPFLPVSWLLRDRFDSLGHLSAYRGRVFIWLGQDDVVVPARFGRRLYDAFGGPKNLRATPGAGHEDVFREPAKWWREVTDFWQLNHAP